MSQRDSGYERKERDLYETPEWVTRALLPHVPQIRNGMPVWEPACGSGKMSDVLREVAGRVIATDIAMDGIDFLKIDDPFPGAFITNPPYVLAEEFICKALALQEKAGGRGIVAMLLRTDFDHAVSRRHIFADHPCFAKKIVLTKRIQWFEDTKGSPSFNHAWFLWDWAHSGAPRLAYAPDPAPLTKLGFFL